MNRFQSAARPSPFRWIRRVMIGGIAILFTVAYFLVLPLLEKLTSNEKEMLEVRAAPSVQPPPPPPPPPVEEEEPEEEETPPELQEQQQNLSLSDLEAALNTGVGGGWGGGSLGVSLDNALGGAGDDFSLGDLDQPPRPVYQPNPRYPGSLQKQSIGGTVHVMFVVDPSGRVENVMVKKSTHQGFEREALAAVRKWRFEPGKRKGKAVAFRMQIPIRFAPG
jgi:protein TonB